MVSYTITVFRANGTTGRLWSFEAEDDNKAKLKAAEYLQEQAIGSGTKAELYREHGKVKIDFPRED